MAGRSWLRADDGRLRAGWRIAIYFALLFAFLIVGNPLVALVPRDWLDGAYRVVSLAAALAAAWVVLWRFDRRPPGALGFPLSRAAPREIGLGLLWGAGLLGVATILLLVTGSARFGPDGGTPLQLLWALGWSLAYFAMAAAYEEAWFRGYAFQALVEGAGVWPAVIASSVLFSWLHAGNPNVNRLAFTNIFLAGVLLALAYLRTRSLWFATAVHAGWNWAMAGVIDFPVSGLLLFDTPLYDAMETGADWWTGGSFGPEAGVAGTLALVVGIVAMLRAPGLREPASTRSLGPLVDRRLGPEEP